MRVRRTVGEWGGRRLQDRLAWRHRREAASRRVHTSCWAARMERCVHTEKAKARVVGLGYVRHFEMVHEGFQEHVRVAVDDAVWVGAEHFHLL